MLAASFYTGVGFQQLKSIYNMAGLTTQSRSSFYNKLPIAESRLVQKAEESMEKARENFSGHVEIDCRWSTPVRGNHGTVSAVDLETNMVIESTTLTKKVITDLQVNIVVHQITWKLMARSVFFKK